MLCHSEAQQGDSRDKGLETHPWGHRCVDFFLKPLPCLHCSSQDLLMSSSTSPDSALVWTPEPGLQELSAHHCFAPCRQSHRRSWCCSWWRSGWFVATGRPTLSGWTSRWPWSMASHPIQQTERKHLKHEENRPVGEVGSSGTPVPSDLGASLSPNAWWAMLGWGCRHIGQSCSQRSQGHTEMVSCHLGSKEGPR